MQITIAVPELGESITEATVSSWLKRPGDPLQEGEVLVELETDKVMVEVPAVQEGVLLEILKRQGEKVGIGEVLGTINTTATTATDTKATGQAKAPVAANPPAQTLTASAAKPTAVVPALSPAVRRMVEEHGLDPAFIPSSGKGGRLTKGDVSAYMAQHPASPAPAVPASSEQREERVPMSRLRQRIAERLLEAQAQAAILTTFNEVDMSAAIALRNRYKEAFKEKHGVALGFMSLFAKASIEALRSFPAVNAEIQGTDIVYKRYYDIGVAVGTERGLVVPVVRNADALRFIEIELSIAELARRAREGKLAIEDLSGGTFTISNGGIYGSMLSTPILNPPQSGILGLHNITKRAVVVDDQVVVRPMMYLALSYDHRIIDGREAVQFLVRIKDCIQDPARMMLEI